MASMVWSIFPFRLKLGFIANSKRITSFEIIATSPKASDKLKVMYASTEPFRIPAINLSLSTIYRRRKRIILKA